MEEKLKVNFFKKMWNSIVKIEKYPDMAAEGVPRAIKYLSQLVLIVSLVLSFGMLYQTNSIIGQGVEYLKSEFPDFSYKDGTLEVKSEEPIIIEEENSIVGKVIIDTREDSEEEINKYVSSIGENSSGIIVLKNKAIIKNMAVEGAIEYEYKQSFDQLQISEFTKQDVINYANSSEVYKIYISVFITLIIYSFVMYFITTLWNAVMLSILGYITSLLTKIKMRYAAIFNMSCYALTLSILLNALYIAINTFVDFKVTYFQVMYISVAFIYLAAAIFIIKSEFIKKQTELIKVVEVEKNIQKELENEEQKKEENKETGKEDKEQEESKKEDKKEEEKSKKDEGPTPEGSNA